MSSTAAAQLEDSSPHRPLADLIHLFRRLSAQPIFCFALPFFTVLFGRLYLAQSVPAPKPYIQDEFGYLLMADSFASGRVTNPLHPLWQHFETVHQLMYPTHMAKFPPLQGLFMAFGQFFFHSPWVGVILSMALFCGTLPWAFRGWVPSHWALIGAMLATYKIGVMSYWTESYWGGGVAALGGALVLGATRRLCFRVTPGLAALYALGAGILANSRPFEGLVFVIGCSAYTLWRWLGRGRWRQSWPTNFVRFGPAACAVALPVLLAMGYYNYRVTGQVTEFPYQEHDKQYVVWSAFIWQAEPYPAPDYRHAFLRRTWLGWDNMQKMFARERPFLNAWQDFGRIIILYYGPVFIWGGFILILALLFGTKGRILLGLILYYCLCTRVVCTLFPHYTAPVASLIYLGATAALRMTCRLSPGGFPLGRAIVLIYVTLFLFFTTDLRTSLFNRFLFQKEHFAEKRNLVIPFLDQQPGPQLVFVDQGSLNDPNEVWIFNGADIDHQRVIWVDDMGPDENQKVLDYYKDQHRTVWELQDDAEMTLRPYDNPNATPIFRVSNPLFPLNF